ncbi:hypothetical protein [Variovorax sp. PCZ-1]|uniref:hypothetical protein n=1 Tax=Variovorax sp. PCZ-1 TaxID=2835533 RepID=UPI001BCAC519|nr:hypothetical protein [Variovorax sp. PCZ-1]MBS7807811.1 hypothetical protein [Variovorax sp. PCZ-1]
MFGSTLIIVDQTPELPVLPVERQHKEVLKKLSIAHGIFSCTGAMDVRSDLVQLEIRYPQFTFELNGKHACFPDIVNSADNRTVLVATGHFAEKGIWLTLAGKKEFLPKRRNYCATSVRALGK